MTCDFAITQKSWSHINPISLTRPLSAYPCCELLTHSNFASILTQQLPYSMTTTKPTLNDSWLVLEERLTLIVRRVQQSWILLLFFFFYSIFFLWPVSYDHSHVSTITLKMMIFQPYVLALTSIIFILWIKKQVLKCTKLSIISCQYQGYEVLPIFYSACSPSWHFLKMQSTGVALRPQSCSSSLVSLHVPLQPSAPGTHHPRALLSCFGPAVPCLKSNKFSPPKTLHMPQCQA